MAESTNPAAVIGGTRPSLAWLPPALTAAGYALTLVVFFPGVMNYDARYVYLDSQKGFYGDWQSPVMTWLWHLINPVAPGSASMFLLIATLYWFGIGILSMAIRRRSQPLAIVLPLLALTPPLFALLGVIWRDVLMAATWLLAAALVFSATTWRTKPRMAAQLLALVLIVFGALIRPNAIAAAPLLITYALWPQRFAWKRTALLFVPLAVALYAIMQIVYYGGLGATRQHPLHSVAVFDLGGVTYFSGENQFPVSWQADEMEALRGRCYDPSYWNVYWNGDCKFVMARLEGEPKIFGTPTLTQAWRDAVFAQPAAYLQHRFAFFRTFLFDSHLAMWREDIDRPQQTVFADRPAFMALTAVQDALEPTPLFRMGTWLLASLVLLLPAWRRRASPEGAFLCGVCGSATLYALSYLPLGVASEFRYIYWTVLASVAGLTVALLPRSSNRTTAPALSS
jgi:hypothetical protein